MLISRLSRFVILCLVLQLLPLLEDSVRALDKKNLPREDVIVVPDKGEGLSVHNLFQSHMVLQRDKPISIWGWAAPGEKVSVSFEGEVKTQVAGEDRTWRVTLPARSASNKPVSMSISGKSKTILLKDILIGDVWVLGGQSNMEFAISKVEDGDLEMASANFPQIRHLTIPAQDGAEARTTFPVLYEWSNWSKRHAYKGEWAVCTTESIRELSAIGYVFARRLHMATGIPIAVIDTSRGGTTVEAWTPPAVLASLKGEEIKQHLAEWQQKVEAFDPEADLKQRIEKHHRWVESKKKRGEKVDKPVPSEVKPGPLMDRNHPGNCYQSILMPTKGLAVKGAIFHQGFNNALSGSFGATMYAQVFGPMVKAWREHFNEPQMPFGILSLCTAGAPQTRENYVEKMSDAGVFIRASQYDAFLKLYDAGDKHIGFASTFDFNRSWYHPQQKVTAGERIARWALATQYGRNSVKWLPPMVKGVEPRDGELVVKLSQHVKSKDGGQIQGFAIAGEDGRFQPAEVSFLVVGKDNRGRKREDKKSLVLTSPLVEKPIHFRYAWGRNPMANLIRSDNCDIPLATQRSDSWALHEAPVDLPGKEKLEGLTGRDYSRKVQGMLRQEMRKMDLQRRLFEAKALVEANQKMWEAVK